MNKYLIILLYTADENLKQTHNNVLIFVHRYIFCQRLELIQEKSKTKRKQIDIYFTMNEKALGIIKIEIEKSYKKIWRK